MTLVTNVTLVTRVTNVAHVINVTVVNNNVTNLTNVTLVTRVTNVTHVTHVTVVNNVTNLTNVTLIIEYLLGAGRVLEYSITRLLDSFESIFLILELDFCPLSSALLPILARIIFILVISFNNL